MQILKNSVQKNAAELYNPAQAKVDFGMVKLLTELTNVVLKVRTKIQYLNPLLICPNF